MWLRTRHEEKKMKVLFDNIEHDNIALSTQHKTVIQEYEKQCKNLDMHTLQLEVVEKSIIEARRKFKFKNDGELSDKDTRKLSKIIFKDKQMIATIKEKIFKVKHIKAKLQDEAKIVKVKYLEVKRKRQYLESELRGLRKNLDINSNAFHSVLGSLVKALIQRKRLIIK